MNRLQAIEVEAKRLFNELLATRQASFATADPQFRADVCARVRQMLAGETLPRIDNPDD